MGSKQDRDVDPPSGDNGQNTTPFCYRCCEGVQMLGSLSSFLLRDAE